MPRRDYREFIRYRLGIRTPVQAGLPGAQPGDQPDWQQTPDNFVLNSAIDAACRTTNQFIHLAGSGIMRTVPMPTYTQNGPAQIDLFSLPGFKDRSIASIRRLYWFDGAESTRLLPVTLDALDVQQDQYLNDSPAVPWRFAIEGQWLYLDPAPSSIGSIQFWASCGVLPPTDDQDSYDQIPEDYDINLNYLAIVESAEMMPGDKEMIARAQTFSGKASAGLERLSSWFNGNNNEQAQSQFMFDARYMRRYRVRR